MAAGDLFKDPIMLRFGLIHALSQEIIQLVQKRDEKIIDPLRKDNKNDPVVLSAGFGAQEKQNIVDAINYRIGLIQAKAAELEQFDLTAFNNLGNIG